jgi:hypothetical protein
MRRFCVTLLLTLALGSTVLGGEIPSVPGPQPPDDGTYSCPAINCATGEAQDVDERRNASAIYQHLIQLMVGVLV